MKMLMMLLFLSLAIVTPKPISYLNAHATKNNDQDTIYWHKNNKLKMEDFKVLARAKSRYSATTDCGITWDGGVTGDSFRVIVRAFFLKRSSWILKDVPADVLLHEQGHFDISEIYARLLRKELSVVIFSFSVDEPDAFWKYINRRIDFYGRYMISLQNIYDKETDNGQDYLMQEQWNARISNDLKFLEAYN